MTLTGNDAKPAGLSGPLIGRVGRPRAIAVEYGELGPGIGERGQEEQE